MFRQIATIASLALSSNAHMFITSPQPIAGTAVKPPLDASGSDFPCHGVTLPTTGGQKMAAGSQQLLAFDLGEGANTAVHGGGSCQMSITYETDPTKLKDPNSWKVIYSIEGGCPTDAKGNLATAQKCATGNEPECVNQFNFNIPKGVKNGHAIMAWTWLNAVGNREMYMNCINTQFTGGDGSEMASFPDMFVANLVSVDQCPTTEDTNVKFPSPGKYVTTRTEGNPYPLAVPTGQGCASAAGGDAGSSSGAAKSSPAAAAPTSQTPAPSSAALSSQAAAPSAAPAPSQAPASSGSCTDGTVACPRPGEIICIDSTYFGICDLDSCAVPQAVAPGTTCNGGKITKRRKRNLEEHKRKFKHGHHH